MGDIREERYAKWLEEVLGEMVDLKPQSIGIVMVMENQTTGTAYYNADNYDMTLMEEAVRQDRLLDFIRVNADTIAGILNGEEEDCDGLCELNPEGDREG